MLKIISPATSPAVLQALEAIFEKPATVVTGDYTVFVRVNLAKELTAEQFRDLAEFSRYQGYYPAVMRSGTGVSIIF